MFCKFTLMTYINNVRLTQSGLIEEIDLLDRKSRAKAIKSIIDGKVVAGHMRHVFGFWVNSSNDQARRLVAQIKGEKPEKKMSIMTTGKFIVKHIEKKYIAENLRKYIATPKIFSSVFGSMCHTILPIKHISLPYFSKTVLSEQNITSTLKCHIVYNLDPTGHPGMEELTSELLQEGIIPAVTSMNQSLKPEIVDLINAKQFLNTLSKHKSIILMRNTVRTRQNILGSFTQLHLVNGMFERDGHIPAAILGWMLDIPINFKTIKKHKYQHKQIKHLFDISQKNKLKPNEVRKEILKFIHLGDV